MELIAIALLALFVIGGSVLAGGDIGAAIRVGAIEGNTRRRVALAAFGPLCLSHEVWLVAGAGLLFGMFSAVEEQIFQSGYPWVVLLLLGWIGRNVGLWLRGRVDHRAWRKVCDALLIGGAVGFAASWGALLALASGGGAIPVVANAIAMPLLLARHGDAYLRLRLASPPPALRTWWPGVVVPLLAVGALGAGPWVAILVAAIAAVSLTRADVVSRPLARASSTAAAVVSTLVPAATAVSFHGAEARSVVPILLVAVIMLPTLLAAQALTWWLHRARVSEPSYL